jgi:anti-sigma B factor antagonist
VEIEVIANEAVVPQVRVVGEIDLHTGPELRATLQRLIDQGHARIILDLSGVPYVDSAALGVMVDAQRRVKERDGEIYLANVTPFVQRAFEITRLIRLFSLHADLEDAKHAAGRAGRKIPVHAEAA